MGFCLEFVGEKERERQREREETRERVMGGNGTKGTTDAKKKM